MDEALEKYSRSNNYYNDTFIKLNQIGSGQFGIVHKVRDNTNSSDYAVKIITFIGNLYFYF